MLYVPNMTKETSCHTVHLSREPLAEEAGMITIWSQELECAEHRKVEENEAELIEKDILDCHVLHEKPSGGPVGDYLTMAKVKKMIKDNLKTFVGVVTTFFVTGTMEVMIEDALTSGYVKQLEGMKT